jgi:hypothetical protein
LVFGVTPIALVTAYLFYLLAERPFITIRRRLWSRLSQNRLLLP